MATPSPTGIRENYCRQEAGRKWCKHVRRSLHVTYSWYGRAQLKRVKSFLKIETTRYYRNKKGVKVCAHASISTLLHSFPVHVHTYICMHMHILQHQCLGWRQRLTKDTRVSGGIRFEGGVGYMRGRGWRKRETMQRENLCKHTSASGGPTSGRASKTMQHWRNPSG